MKTICKISFGFSALIILFGCGEKPAVHSIPKSTVTAAKVELISDGKPLVFEECIEPTLYSHPTQASTKPVCEIFKDEFTTEAISNISVIHSIRKNNIRCCITVKQDGNNQQTCRPPPPLSGNTCPAGWTRVQ